MRKIATHGAIGLAPLRTLAPGLAGERQRLTLATSASAERTLFFFRLHILWHVLRCAILFAAHLYRLQREKEGEKGAVEAVVNRIRE